MKRFDHFMAGFVAGLLGTVLGFFILAIVWARVNKMSVAYFIDEIFIKSDLFKDKILTVSVLLNVVTFYFSNRAGYYRMSKGLLAAVLLVVPFIIYFN